MFQIITDNIKNQITWNKIFTSYITENAILILHYFLQTNQKYTNII